MDDLYDLFSSGFLELEGFIENDSLISLKVSLKKELILLPVLSFLFSA
jgi:hypothetical protein